MMIKVNPQWFVAAVLFFCSCSHFVYLPKSAKQKYFARPHIQFMMAVVSFREATGVWPTAPYQLISHNDRNKKIIDDFQYALIYFSPHKNDRLIVHFDGYKKKFYLDDDDETDLNRFRGNIVFYKSGDKFAWKVKM